ncbi:hypothetical protein, partial [Escherichia coli]|uniref:hypothetical protein n=1 Tax=Escherichia coli TaxID=562 RepID=UPI001BE4289B
MSVVASLPEVPEEVTTPLAPEVPLLAPELPELPELPDEPGSVLLLHAPAKAVAEAAAKVKAQSRTCFIGPPARHLSQAALRIEHSLMRSLDGDGLREVPRLIDV